MVEQKQVEPSPATHAIPTKEIAYPSRRSYGGSDYLKGLIRPPIARQSLENESTRESKPLAGRKILVALIVLLLFTGEGGVV